MVTAGLLRLPVSSMSNSGAPKHPHPVRLTWDVTNGTIELCAVVESRGPRGTDGPARLVAPCGEEEEEEEEEEECGDEDDERHGQLLPVRLRSEVR
jgi:hypothetical protein